MNLSALLAALEDIAPTKYAESWDNVGLLAGDPNEAVSKAILTIDYTPAVAEEAMREGCDAVIAYHPPIFEAIKRVTAGSVVFDAIRRGVAIYSPHTALDVADGGTNDMLADAVGMGKDRAPLKVAEMKSKQHKLVVFVPEQNVDAVSASLFAAGAGRIGKYSSCSFRSPGTGTFFGEAGTNPAIGKSGQLERAAEVRLETVVPLDRVEAVVKALRASHPYEEPAFDLVMLAADPEGRGIGRVGDLAAPVPRDRVIEQLKRALAIGLVLVAGPTEGVVRRAAVCAGACGDLLNAAIAQKADLYVTGEMRHHDALKAAKAGVTVVCTLHSNSERAVLQRLRGRLEKALPGLGVIVSREDRDPFRVV